MQADQSARLIIFSGAGLSADSGIQTFRGDSGLWEDHDIDVVANGYTWKKNFDIVRNFYNDRRSSLAGVNPNAAHRAIAEWQQSFETTVITQNIDDLLERAGCMDVIHVHGKLTEMRCEACGNVWDIGYGTWGEDDRCARDRCNSLKGVRPNVVFFNEMAPEYRKMHHAFRGLTGRDCIVVIGTSGQVVSMDQFLWKCSALKILNNLEHSLYMSESLFDHVLYGKASDMATELTQLISSHMTQPTESNNVRS